jgi:hypothetical protein
MLYDSSSHLILLCSWYTNVMAKFYINWPIDSKLLLIPIHTLLCVLNIKYSEHLLEYQEVQSELDEDEPCYPHVPSGFVPDWKGRRC